MINLSKITKAIEELLTDANTSSEPYVITRNKTQNTDDGIASIGWVGIYRESVSLIPRRTGSLPYQTDPKVRIEVQAASMASEEECEEKLDDLVEFVLTVLASNIDLKGYVGYLKDYEVDYDDNFGEGIQEVYYQFATITITGEVNS